MEEMAPFYAQVIGIGVIWVTVHCIGMCGPIMASLTAATGINQARTPGKRLWRALKGVVSYQGGRAVVYAGLGAAAGGVGAGAQALIEDLAQTAGLAVAVLILAVGLWKLLPFSSAVFAETSGGSFATRWTAWALRRIGRRLPSSGVARMAAFGFALGFLPCVLMFWVLGIAASTASVVHGAAVMVLLVAMTTPVLLAAALGSSLPGFFRKLRSDRVIGAAMVVSGTWLALIAAAANGWIGHVHLPVEVGGRELVIMLW